MELLCIGSIDINLHVYQPRPGARLARGGGSPLPFIENCKKVLISEKNYPDCVHIWIKFLI